jgi:predicted membrane-bound spermidine synthase
MNQEASDMLLEPQSPSAGTLSSQVLFGATGILFFASGFSALLYQLAWQRTLFGWYGVELDSVSAIVSIFMLGLGVGALIGGWLADKLARRRILLFAALELTIAAFGVVSLFVIDAVGASFPSLALPYIVIATFVLLILPTCAMGATLPILVIELVERNGNIGVSTGYLYFVNTLGAALGAYASGFVLLPRIDLTTVVQLAATLNLLISIGAALLFRRSQ